LSRLAEEGLIISQSSNRSILAVLFVGVLMGALDISIVGPAIPSIEETIQVDQRSLGWIFSIYVLFNLVGISLFAKLSDRFGRRNIYMLAIAIFGMGSLVVALSPDFSILLWGRAIQGFGASGIFPVASAVVGDLFPPEKRGSALGLIGAVFGIAFMVGPILAGTLLAFFEWHVLFTINLPIAAVLLFASWKLLPSNPIGESRPIDLWGVLLLAMFLSAFALGINRIDVVDLGASLRSLHVWPFLVSAPLFLLVFLFIERQVQDPVVKLDLFRNRQIRLVGIIAVGTGLLQASFVFIPDFAVGTFAVSSSQASFMLVPVVLATAIGSPIFGKMLDRIGSRPVILTGLVLAATGYLSLSFVAASKMIFYGGGALIGAGMSILAGSSLRYIMLNEVGARERATTQGVLTIFIALGQLSGSALIGMITANASVEGYRNSFLMLSFFLMVLMLLSVRLKKRADELATVHE